MRCSGCGVTVASALQEAAGYFKLLHDVVAPQLDEVPSFDISIDSTEMLELLMLAQAQESFFQKASRDKKNPAVLSRCDLLAPLTFSCLNILPDKPP